MAALGDLELEKEGLGRTWNAAEGGWTGSKRLITSQVVLEAKSEMATLRGSDLLLRLGPRIRERRFFRAIFLFHTHNTNSGF